MFNKLFGKFSKDLGIDLGTSNTLIYAEGRGIVVNEPSVVAVNTRTSQILAVGKDAQRMIGKTPPHVTITHPLVDGVISDFEVTEKMLKFFMDKLTGGRFLSFARPRVVIAIPLDITEVERKAVEDAVLSAGAREVFLIEKIMATAIGARIPVREATGNMIVDLGGGTTEIAVISLDGVVTWKSLRLAGDELTQNIVQYVRDHFNLLLGEKMAEEAKIKIGTAKPQEELLEMQVRGRDLMTGLPREMTLTSEHIRDAIIRSLRLMIDDIKATLEVTPPELVADIFERGIILSGGGALLKSMDRAIADATQIPVRVTDDPLTAVARGAGIVLENLSTYQDILIPSAQER